LRENPNSCIINTRDLDLKTLNITMMQILRVIIYKDTFIKIHLLITMYIKIICQLKK